MSKEQALITALGALIPLAFENGESQEPWRQAFDVLNKELNGQPPTGGNDSE